MRPGPVLLLVIVLLGIACCCAGMGGDRILPEARPAPDAGGIAAGKGRYVFTDSRGNADRPLVVYTYRPASWNASGPILIVMHGASRSAVPSRNTWIPYGDLFSCLIVAPEFSLKYYPDDSWYPAGHVIDEETGWQPRQNWTYMAVEHIFDDIRNRTGARQETYLLFGHSAGGQFVHRLVTFLPEARFSRAVAANAGVYAMPTYAIGYGLGLKGSPLREADLPDIFGRKLIILSGEDDTVRDSGLATFPAADAQGRNRFERAANYYATAQQEAERRNMTLNWEYHVVPGVGHSEAGMAGPAALLMFAPV